LKDFYWHWDIENVFNNITRLKHGNDGIILTKDDCSYITGKNIGLLKWKPYKQNTVDFYLDIE